MSMLFLDAMIASERIYDSSVGALSDCLVAFRKEEAVVSDTDSLADETALLRILVGGTNDRVPMYSYNSDEEEEAEEISSQDLVTLIQERLKENKAKEAAESAEKNEASKLELLCSHEQYGLDMCMFFLSPKSPLHSPDQNRRGLRAPNPAEEDEQVVPENDTNDNDEAWFGIDCANVLCGQYAIETDEKTAETVANSESSKDGSTTVSGSHGDSTIESSEDEESIPVQSRALAASAIPENALAAHLKRLIAKNKKGDHCEGLDCNQQSILSGEIRVPTEQQPEPIGRSMTQPSDDDYLMLIQGDPKGTSFCTDDSPLEESELDDLWPQEIRSVPSVPPAEFSPRDHQSDPMNLEPDGTTLPPVDEVSVESECQIIHDTKTNGIEMVHMELVAADILQETGSVSSSKMSQRALLDDDHESVLDEDAWDPYQEPDGTKFADDIVLSSVIAKDKPLKKHLPPTKMNLPPAKPLSADDIIEAMSDDGDHTDDIIEASMSDDDNHTEVFSEPFDETEENVRSSPCQQIRNEIAAVDGAHCSFELPTSRQPKTNLQKRLNLLEILRGLEDDDTDMLCACVQGCGDFADGTFFEDTVDGASQEEGDTVEQLSLD